MAVLPRRLPWELAEDRWATLIEPIIKLPPNQGLVLKNVVLATGDNVINHKLGRTLQGWHIDDITAASQIYRSQPLNDLTLTLNSSAPCTVSIRVY